MGKQQYSAEFKIEAIKRAERTGDPVTKIAAELGVKPTRELPIIDIPLHVLNLWMRQTQKDCHKMCPWNTRKSLPVLLA